jgi:hypothetical protein
VHHNQRARTQSKFFDAALPGTPRRLVGAAVAAAAAAAASTEKYLLLLLLAFVLLSQECRWIGSMSAAVAARCSAFSSSSSIFNTQHG